MNEFERLGLSQPLVNAIAELGFVDPTPIQSKAIPWLLQKERDFVGLAQTGTGKTAAFGLPLMDLLNMDIARPQALILSPTRELCLQIADQLNLYGKHLQRLSITAVYGGTDISQQIYSLKRGTHIVVATPGRLRDLLRRKAVDLRNVEFVVLDEADEMLNMGFKEEIDDILQYTSDEAFTWLFSATMPAEVRRIARTYMDNPYELNVSKQTNHQTDIDHQYVVTRSSYRYEVLRRFLDVDASTFGVIFCRTRKTTQALADRLVQDGYQADALHGDLNQAQRDRVMDKFRSKRLQVLVATDVAARGIDVQDITHVFHYNIPEDLAFYTHRSGRTARAGKEGISLALVHPKDLYMIRRMERELKIDFTLAHIPTGQEICEQRLKSYMEKVQNAEPDRTVTPYLPALKETLEDLTKEELIEKLAAFVFSQSLQDYQRAPDLNRMAQEKKKREPRDRRRGNMKRLHINIGSQDLDGKAPLIRMICRRARISGRDIGKIDLHRKHAFVDIEERVAGKVVNSFEDFYFQGRMLEAMPEGEKKATKKRKNRKRKRRKKDAVNVAFEKS